MANLAARRAVSATTTAATEDVITFDSSKYMIRVTNRENTVSGTTSFTTADTLWVTVDGTTASVAGADNFPVLPGETIEFWPQHSIKTVRVIATNAVEYTVAAVR